jgi:SRSO17 transposase
MVETIVQSYECLSNFLSAFRKGFKNIAQYRHFQAYVVGLIIYLGSKNLAGSRWAIPDGRAACSIYRFVAQMEWDAAQVEQVRWEMLNRRTRRAVRAAVRKGQKVPAFLAIDDTLVEKTGKKMEGVDRHYSTRVGRNRLGHVWVTGHLIVLGHSYPVSWKFYARQAVCQAIGRNFLSKIDLAQVIVREFEPLPGTQTYVLTDAWYPSHDMLKTCARRGFFYISAVKSDRKFAAGQHNLQVQQWVQALPKRAFDLVTVNAQCYKVWSATGTLTNGQRVKLVINRTLGTLGQPWRYLISTDLSLSAATILSYYLARWEVENFYRATKQLLGWGDYQVRDLYAVERHILLMMAAHAFLEIQRQEAYRETVEPDAHFTLGDIQHRYQALARRASIAQIVDLAQRGFSLDAIYQKVAA